MANEENLTLMGKAITTTEQAQRMGRKGGKVKSPKKQWAARLRSMKKKGLTDENYKRIYSVMTEKDSFVLDSYSRLQIWLKECKDVKEKAIIERLIQDVLKYHHGSSDLRTQLNIQANDSQVIINIVEPKEDEDNMETE